VDDSVFDVRLMVTFLKYGHNLVEKSSNNTDKGSLTFVCASHNKNKGYLLPSLILALFPQDE
jgi:hypothetical protein